MIEIKLPDGNKVLVRNRLDLCYVIQGDDASAVVKVGRSSNPVQRVAGLVSGVPFKARLVAVMLDGTRREKEMKSLLAPHKVQGEWFLPSTELQRYLDAARAANAIVVKTDITEDYFHQHIRPVIETYLNGRQPAVNESGDFVYRVLREGVSALAHRQNQLLTALAGQITPEVVAGYLPIPFGMAMPAIHIPGAPAPKTEAA